jgi:peptide chain release factor 1
VFEKLQTDYQRFLEIERLLLDPEVTADVARVTALSKERGAIAKIAIPYGRYLELSRQITEAEQLCAAETDSEMRSYAEAELEDLRARHQQEGENLRDMLYDSRAGTSHAAMIVEIRAGAGGDEAALFSSSRAAATASSASRRPRPRAGSTPPRPRSPSCPSPRRSTS